MPVPLTCSNDHGRRPTYSPSCAQTCQRSSANLYKHLTEFSMRQGRILVLDDEAKWREAISKALARSFHVDVAADPAVAEELLESGLYHLLVLDISMDVDNNNRNIEGMQFLERLKAAGKTTGLVVIILSGFGQVLQARDAFVKYGVTDFLEKQRFDNHQFAELVQSHLFNNLRINLDLDIRWKGIHGAEAACWNVKVGGVRLKREDPHHAALIARAGAELDDLLCRLFHNASTILVQPMQRGKSGAGILRVEPFYSATGPGRTAVVKFGDVESILREEKNFQLHVKQFLGGGRSTSLEDLRQTPLLAGIRYSLLGESDEEFDDFETFYQSHGVSEIRGVLENLFKKTCSAWYANTGSLQLRDLGEEYGSLLNLTAERLDDPLKRGLKAVKGKDKLFFDSLGGTRAFANPVMALGSHSYLWSVYSSITHGDLNGNNILVDRSGSTWLIDFVQTGPGHVLRDFALLDTVVRLLFLTPAEATLAERLALEEALLEIRHWSDAAAAAPRLKTENEAVAKSFATVRHLRRMAAEQVSRNPRSEMKEYWVALLYFSLNHIRFWDLPTVQREHALLAAALLAENLST